MKPAILAVVTVLLLILPPRLSAAGAPKPIRRLNIILILSDNISLSQR